MSLSWQPARRPRRPQCRPSPIEPGLALAADEAGVPTDADMGVNAKLGVGPRRGSAATVLAVTPGRAVMRLLCLGCRTSARAEDKSQARDERYSHISMHSRLPSGALKKRARRRKVAVPGGNKFTDFVTAQRRYPGQRRSSLRPIAAADRCAARCRKTAPPSPRRCRRRRAA